MMPSSQGGLSPEGDVHVQYAMRRMVKTQAPPKQTLGRVTGPPKLMPVKKY